MQQNLNYTAVDNAWLSWNGSFTPLVDAANAPPTNHNAAVALEGNIYSIGGALGANGFTYVKSLHRYSIADGTWEEKAPMSVNRGRFSAVALGGLIDAIGGTSTGAYLNSVEAYNPATNSWTMMASLSAPRIHYACGVVQDKIYVAGGYNSVAYVRLATSLEIYNPATNSRSAGAAMPANSAYVSGVGMGGSFYVLNSSPYRHTTPSPPWPSTQEDEFWRYTVASNSWAVLAPTATRRSRYPALFAYGGIVHAFGGQYNVDADATVEAYDADANSWAVSTAIIPTYSGVNITMIAVKAVVVLSEGACGAAPTPSPTPAPPPTEGPPSLVAGVPVGGIMMAFDTSSDPGLDSGSSAALSVRTQGSPVLSSGGVQGTALRLDGVDDAVMLDTGIVPTMAPEGDTFTLAFHVKLEPNQRAGGTYLMCSRGEDDSSNDINSQQSNNPRGSHVYWYLYGGGSAPNLIDLRVMRHGNRVVRLGPGHGVVSHRDRLHPDDDEIICRRCRKEPHHHHYMRWL